MTLSLLGPQVLAEGPRSGAKGIAERRGRGKGEGRREVCVAPSAGHARVRVDAADAPDPQCGGRSREGRLPSPCKGEGRVRLDTRNRAA